MCRLPRTLARCLWSAPYSFLKILLSIRKVLLEIPREIPLGRTVLGVVALLVLAALQPLTEIAAHAAERPPVMGRNGGVSAGHPLTTAAALEILARGGNAFDAGVAALLVGGVVEQDLYGLGGEALVLVYPRSAGKGEAVVGPGQAPAGATISWDTAPGK